MVFMETPPPPARLVIPVDLPEPPPPTPAVVEAPPPPPAPARRDPVATARPTEKPSNTPPAETTPPPVLRSATDTSATERKILQLIELAQHTLAKVSYRDLNENARTQYDFAQNSIRQANDAIRNRNYTYAEFLATRAASLAAQLIKG